MKLNFKPMILMFIFMAFFMSCNNDELFDEEPIVEVVNDEIGADETI